MAIPECDGSVYSINGAGRLEDPCLAPTERGEPRKDRTDEWTARIPAGCNAATAEQCVRDASVLRLTHAATSSSARSYARARRPWTRYGFEI